ncbi:RICIN domain-containing protein [Natrinema salaciae]|uniref:Ricin-type beta-trefoil lectin domain-like n=1 Tax=Natrinema salaciae TaxID=1186196 RepID=A0A1H9NWH4_9EURY|nr:RICIN domain-containing protein [Natrinema salaciae]SER40015.1 Ricin-type beta-trefoil lectin domain-like [Natrinema salaciae]
MTHSRRAYLKKAIGSTGIALGALGGAAGSAAADAAGVEDGAIYRITPVHSGKALDLAAKSTENGANVQQYSWNGGDNQRWRFEHLSGNVYRIVNVHSGKVLDIEGTGNGNGTSCIQYGWANVDWQRWEVTQDSNGQYSITNVHTGKVVDVEGKSTDDGADVLTWEDNGGDNQRFDLEKLSGDGGDGGGDGGDGGNSGTTSEFGLDDGFADTSWFDDSVQVIKVTEPTRSAVEDAFQTSGPRLVVFETSGTIDLGGETLQITEDNCWVAGQTAPSPGITFIKGMVQIDANDCVVQHIRSRIGPGSDGDIQGNDSLNTADDTTNNVVDHVTASWGVDECLSVGYDTNDTTVTNCLVYEGLYDPYGDGSDHNYGSLIGDGAENVTLAGNVWGKIRARVPRLKGGTRSVVANNVMYFFNEATAMDGDSDASIVGNLYIPQDVEDTPIEGGNAFLEDNVTDPSSTPLTGGTSELSSRPLWPSGLETMDAGSVESHNLAYAGARPADRTDNDSRIVSEIEGRDGDAYLDSPYDYWIADHNDVGGYPSLPENTHSLSPPSSGLRDWVEQWALAVEDPNASSP